MAWVWGPSFVSLLVFMGKSVHLLDEQKQPPNWRGPRQIWAGCRVLEIEPRTYGEIARRRCRKHSAPGVFAYAERRNSDPGYTDRAVNRAVRNVALNVRSSAL